VTLAVNPRSLSRTGRLTYRRGWKRPRQPPLRHWPTLAAGYLCYAEIVGRIAAFSGPFYEHVW